MLSIYTAGPIDLGRDIPSWPENLGNLIEEADLDFLLYKPMRAFQVQRDAILSAEAARLIENTNNQALFMADVMVCCLPAGVQTIGVPIEMHQHAEAGKHLILMTNLVYGRSAYLINRVSKDDWIQLAALDADAVQDGLQQVVERIKLIAMTRNAVAKYTAAMNSYTDQDQDDYS